MQGFQSHSKTRRDAQHDTVQNARLTYEIRWVKTFISKSLNTGNDKEKEKENMLPALLPWLWLGEDNKFLNLRVIMKQCRMHLGFICNHQLVASLLVILSQLLQSVRMGDLLVSCILLLQSLCILVITLHVAVVSLL